MKFLQNFKKWYFFALCAGLMTLLVTIIVAPDLYMKAESRLQLFTRTQKIWGEYVKKTGFVVKEVLVEGRKETTKEELAKFLGFEIGTSMFSIDPQNLQTKLEEIGWIKTARVARYFPDRIYITLEERHPVAIWQKDGVFRLIDADGVAIGERDVHRYRHLKIVVGETAPQHAMELLALLRKEPELDDLVVAAQRVGDRRWNIRLSNGIDIHLPEKKSYQAWRRLALYQAKYKILARALKTIDLRYSDRLILRATDDATNEIRLRISGSET